MTARDAKFTQAARAYLIYGTHLLVWRALSRDALKYEPEMTKARRSSNDIPCRREETVH